MPLTLRGQDSSTGSLLPGLALALLLTGCVAVKPPANVVSPDVGPPCVPPTPVASTPAPIPTGDPATDAMATAAAAAADAHASHMAIAAYHDCLAKKAVRQERLTTSGVARDVPGTSRNAFDEVGQVGVQESGTRTGEQTAYALWWMEFVEGSVNRLTRRLVEERGMQLPDAARLFALLSMSLYDTYIAVWDSKYEFAHWRPYSAIGEAANDGNPATAPDASWESLRPAPPFPEYVSAHAAACAATFAILRRELGTIGQFTFATLSAPESMPTRTFASFEDAAAECADSRVRLGWHFRYSTDAGLELGRAVARYIAERHLGGLPGADRGASSRR